MKIAFQASTFSGQTAFAEHIGQEVHEDEGRTLDSIKKTFLKVFSCRTSQLEHCIAKQMDTGLEEYLTSGDTWNLCEYSCLIHCLDTQK